MAHYTVEAYNDMIRALEKFKEETQGVVASLIEAGEACRTTAQNDDPSKKAALNVYQKLYEFVNIYSKIESMIEALKQQRNALQDI